MHVTKREAVQWSSYNFIDACLQHCSPVILPWLCSAADMRLICSYRHIDKVGGLDNYILTVPKRKQQSDIAEHLRQRIEGALQKPLQDALQANTEAGWQHLLLVLRDMDVCRYA